MYYKFMTMSGFKRALTTTGSFVHNLTLTLVLTLRVVIHPISYPGSEGGHRQACLE